MAEISLIIPDPFLKELSDSDSAMVIIQSNESKRDLQIILSGLESVWSYLRRISLLSGKIVSNQTG